MIRRQWFNVLVLSTSLVVGDLSVAQDDPGGPVAFVTAVTGKGATRGVSGPSFPAGRDRFSDEDSGVRAGEAIVTPPDGTAVVTLPGYQTIVRLDASSHLQFGNWAGGENDVPTTLTLVSGRAYILRSRSDGWLVVAVTGATKRAYGLSKARSMVVTSDETGAALAVLDGEAIWFAGSIPGEGLLDESGRPGDKTGIVVREGQRISTEMVAEPVPADMSREMARDMGGDVYAFGLSQSERWVKDAERGDFTPVLAAARGTAQFFRGGLTTEMVFDQPRSVVTAPAPRAVTQPLRVTPQNPARALVESGLPTSVIVGQRLRRTRIIGNPGTSGGQIRANPNVEQLIRLSGTSR